jgi:hypothetical protein
MADPRVALQAQSGHVERAQAAARIAVAGISGDRDLGAVPADRRGVADFAILKLAWLHGRRGDGDAEPVAGHAD